MTMMIIKMNIDNKKINITEKILNILIKMIAEDRITRIKISTHKNLTRIEDKNIKKVIIDRIKNNSITKMIKGTTDSNTKNRNKSQKK